MQLSRTQPAALALGVAFFVTLTPVAQAVISIDNYLVDGVPSAADQNDPAFPYAEASNISGGPPSFDSFMGSSSASVDGFRNLSAQTVSGSGPAFTGDMTSKAAIINYGPANQQGLQFAVSKDNLFNDSYFAESRVTYGSTNKQFNVDLDLDLIGEFGAGQFVLSLQNLTATGASSGFVNVTLELATNNDQNDGISGNEFLSVNRRIENTNIASIIWDFSEFSSSILSDLDRIDLILSTGNVGDGFTNVSFIADSFSVVPEPSAYALVIGLISLGVLTFRKHRVPGGVERQI